MDWSGGVLGRSLQVMNGTPCVYSRRWMLLAMLLLLGGCDRPGVPLLSGERLSGERLTVDGAEAQWVLVNYWATWCTPCRAEIPELNHLHQARDVRVVGVNFDQLDEIALRQAVAEMGIEFDVALADPRALWSYPMPQGLPATIVIAPDGQVRTTLLGPQTEAGLRQVLVSEEPSAP